METAIPPKRIRESAPFRKSMSMNQEDIDRAAELEKLFTFLYPGDAPFSFSKTISKALEIAYDSITALQHTPQELKKPEETSFRQLDSEKTRPSKLSKKWKR